MKKIEGFTESILTANPKEEKGILGSTSRVNANNISQTKFAAIDKFVENKLKGTK